MVHKQSVVWQEDFKVRSYEMDREARASFQAISNYLMEAAANHAYQLKLSVAHLKERYLTWVLSRLHIRIDQYPLWQEKIWIETWPSKLEELYALRDFRIINNKDKVIGVATSSWMLIDIRTRRPIRMPDFMDGYANEEKGRALIDPFDKLPALQKIDYEKQFNVRLSDLDINQHVNFINYIEWAIETVPENVWKAYQLGYMQISFRAESNYGDRILSHCETGTDSDQKIFIHRLLKEGTETELTRLVTRWTSKKHQS